MTQEEKAKAYDEVRDKIALRFGTNVAKEIFSQFEESDDERIRKALIKLFKTENFNGYVTLDGIDIENVLTWLEKQGEQKPADTEKGTNGNDREIPIPEPPLTIKHAKEVMGIKQDDVWSEEDAKALNRISTILVDASEVKNWWKEYRLIERDEMIRLTDFLKSLKPQNRWKPSDAQMKALDDVISSRDIRYDVLSELWKDLKKLMEE